MKMLILNRKRLVFVLAAVLIVFGIQGSYAQTITATLQPKATLEDSLVILTLNGRTYEGTDWEINSALKVSGTAGFNFSVSDVDRVSATEVAVKLRFRGDVNIDDKLTFTLEADAIFDYNGPALMAEIPITVKATETNNYIQGPWLWMIAEGSNIDLDYLAIESDGAITETQVAQNGVNEGDTFGELQWTSGRLSLETYCRFLGNCTSDNVNEVVNEIGLGSRSYSQYSAYALININSTRDQNDVWMGAGSDDSVKVWLNGTAVHRNKVDRPSTGIQDWFRVKLKAGDNLLLVKVSDYWGGWGLFFKIYLDDADFTTVIPNTGTPSPPTSERTIVRIYPASVASPAIGNELTFSLNIADGEAVAGYQATVAFDTTALRYVSSANGDFLPAGAFFVEPEVERNLVKLNAASLAGESDGKGTLATLTFEVVAVKASTLALSDVLLSDSEGESSVPQIENAQITEPTGLKGDVNGDGTVNIADLVLVASNLGKTGQNAADVNGDGVVNIADLVLVAGALGTSAAAPSLFSQSLSTLTAADVKLWLSQAQSLILTDATSQKGILFLEQLLAALIPKETALLANYPNPFNPETWIPYHLAKDADVTLTIYAIDGWVVRRLVLGHQPAGMYQSRSRAAYWDGRNAFGEPVASGVYFYTLTAGDFTATRKMLIRK